MVTVTKHNFLEESSALIKKLPSAAYVSMDLEMTGLCLPNNSHSSSLSSSSSSSSSRPIKCDSPADRYTKMKEIPETYNIIQVGIAVFTENPRFRRFVKNKVGNGKEDKVVDDDEVGDDDEVDDDGNDGDGDGNRGNEGDNGDDSDDNDNGNDSHDAESGESDDTDALIIAALPHRRSQPGRESSGQNQNHLNGQHGPDGQIDGRHNVLGLETNGENNINNNARGNEEARNDGGGGGGDDDGDDGDDGDSTDSSDDENSDNDGDNFAEDGDGDGDDDSVDSENSAADSNDPSNQDQEPPEFLVYKYNFYLFPAPQSSRLPSKDVTLNPASIAFLIEQEMDFGEWIVNGVPYTTLDNARAHLNQFNSKYEKEKPEDKKQGGPASPPPLEDQNWSEPSDPNEVAFIARSMANLREWIDSAAPSRRNINDLDISLEEEESLGIVKILPHHKKEHLRNCLFRKIKYEYPSLHWQKHNSQNYVLRLSEDEKKVRDERIKRVEWRKMHNEKIGFARVFKAISDACRGELGDIDDVDGEYQQFLDRSKENVLSLTPTTKNRRRVPLVVHNGFMDLLFLMTHFHSHKLPSNYADAKKVINHYFPVVYDTKVLATEFTDFRFRSKNSSLSDLYQRHVMGIQNINEHEHNEVLMRLVYPRVEIMNDIAATSHRDAGDDAFMTGAVFQCLSRPIINHAILGLPEPVDERTHLYSAMIHEQAKGVGSLLFLDEKYSRKNEAVSLFGTNKSIFTVDLDQVEDPLKTGYSKSTIFRVSHVETPMSCEDINAILSKTRDPDNGKVPYEIISMRCDSLHSKPTQTIVAARIKSPRSIHTSIFNPLHVMRLAEALERHGYLIRQELEKHFAEECIVSLEEYMDCRDIPNEQEKVTVSRVSSIVSSVWSLVGLSSWYKHPDDDNTMQEGSGANDNEYRQSRKRRRTS